MSLAMKESIVLSSILLTLCVSGRSVAQSLPFDPPRLIQGGIRAPSTTAFADMDGNGVLDIVAANALPLGGLPGPGGIYELNFDYSLEREVPVSAGLDPGLHFVSTLCCGDFDSDGFPDVVTVDDNGAIHVHLHGALTNSGAAPSYLRRPKTFTRLKSVGGKTNYDRMRKFACTGIRPADFDGDGKLDLALAGQTQRFLNVLSYQGVFVLAGDGDGELRGEYPAIPGDIAAFELSDFNADGRIDVIGVSRDGKLLLAKNDGYFRFRVHSHRLSRPANPSRFAYADMNGDGRKDYLISGIEMGRTVVMLYFADANGLPGAFQELKISPSLAQHPIDAIVPADFDQDGTLDLAMLHAHRWKEALLSVRFGHRTGFTRAVEVPLGLPLEFNSIPGVLDRLQALDLDGDVNPELILCSTASTKRLGLAHWIWRNRSPRRHGVQYRGEASPGMNHTKPTIAAIGEARLGNESFALHVRSSNPDSMLGVVIFHAHYRPYVFEGLTLHVFPLFQIPYMTLPFDDRSFARVPLSIPSDTRLTSYEYWFQALTRDPFAENSFHVTGTRALGIRFRPR